MHFMCTEACTSSELLSLCLVQAGSLLGITLTEIQSYSRNGQAAQPPASVFNLSSQLPLSRRRLLDAHLVELGLTVEQVASGRQLLDVKPLESGLGTESQDAGWGLVQAHHTGHADSRKTVSHHRDKADQALAIDAASSVVPDDAEVTERPVIMIHSDEGRAAMQSKGLGSTQGQPPAWDGQTACQPLSVGRDIDYSVFAGFKMCPG